MSEYGKSPVDEIERLAAVFAARREEVVAWQEMRTAGRVVIDGHEFAISVDGRETIENDSVSDAISKIAEPTPIRGTCGRMGQ